MEQGGRQEGERRGMKGAVEEGGDKIESKEEKKIIFSFLFST